MDFSDFLEKVKKETNETIEKYIPRKISKKWFEETFGKIEFEVDLNAIQKSLIDPIWEFLDRGGKRLRAAIFRLVVRGLGKDDSEIIDFSIIPELVHNGTLIIDDIEDRGELRRGKSCLHLIFGEDIAINAGNFLYFFPLLIIEKNKENLNEKTLSRIYETFLREMVNLHLGQGTDIFWHKGHSANLNESQYFQMCANKTGCLLRLSAKLAAILCGVDEIKTEKIGKIFEKLGIAFQIRDDVLDIELDKEERKKFGKSIGNDIKEGKRSLLVIYTLKKASEKDKKRLIEILNKHTDSLNEILEAIEIIKKYGAIEYANQKAFELMKEALEEIDSLFVDEEAKQLIRNLSMFLIKRKI